MRDRMRNLRSLLAEKKTDAILLTSPLSIHYYTSFHGFALEEREGFALITKEKSYLLTSKLYEGAVNAIPDTTSQIYSSDSPFASLLKQLLIKHSVLSLGVEANNLTLSEFMSFKKLAKIIPLQIRTLRIKKTSEEIAAIQKACTIADIAFETIVPKIKAGITEKQVASSLENKIRNQGATISFRPIVAFGKNAAIPHHLTSDQKLMSNDLILIDFGAKVDGYCSDMTRTFFIGKSTEEQKKAYETVAISQDAAVTFLKQALKKNTKIRASDIDMISRTYIELKGYSTIPHSLGHGIGLEVHEPPYLGPGSIDQLEDGMIFSIEPGIYLEGKFGIRIEDLFTIQNGRLTQLTTASKLKLT